MHTESAVGLADTVRGIEQLKAAHPAVTFWIGVLGRMGGHGDWMIDCAVGRAAKRHWQGILGDETVGAMVVGIATAEPANYDISAGQPGIDAALRAPMVHWRPRSVACTPCFDLTLDGRYVLRTRFDNRGRFADAQADANDAFAPYREFYDGFPLAAHRLAATGLHQFDLMSLTAGFPITPDDLALSLATPRLAGHPRRDPRDLALYAGCVTIHNGQGEGPGTKTLPRAVPVEIVRSLARRGIPVVQVGIRHNTIEPPIEGAVDLRGLRLGETATVIQGARLHVDGEGFLVHVARAVGTHSCVFFGPTPPSVFGYRENVNYTRAVCPEPPGPHCWWCKPGWSQVCPKGFKSCINLPQPETAAAVVCDALDALSAPAPVRISEDV